MRPPQERPTRQVGFVRHAELKHARLAISNDIHGFGDNCAFDTAARDGAVEVPILVNDEMRADGARGGTPGFP